jgi:hypothetical protein
MVGYIKTYNNLDQIMSNYVKWYSIIFHILFLGCFDPMIFSRGPYFDCPAQARLITPSVVSERLKVNGSVARQAIRHLEDWAGAVAMGPRGTR